LAQGARNDAAASPMSTCGPANHAAASRPPSELTVSLRAVSGDVIWGPAALRSTADVAVVRRIAAEALKQPAPAVRILHQGDVLQPGSSLGAAGVPDGAELGVVVLSMHTEVRQLLRKVRDVAWVSTGEDPERVPAALVPGKLAEAAAACGCEKLPEDVRTWLQVILGSGKTVQDNPEQKYDLDEGCRISSSTLVGTCTQHQPGLFYLAIDSFDEMFMGCSHWGCVMIDLQGKLAELLGASLEDAQGAVWYANLQWDSSEAFLTTAPSLEMWRQVMDDERFTIKHGAPRRVAPDLTEFFRLWAARGRPPQFEARRLPALEECRGPPRCSA